MSSVGVNTALYIRGLPKWMKKKSIANLIQKVTLSRPRRVCVDYYEKAWAIATFSTCEDAQAALEKLHGYQRNESSVPLIVQFKTPKHQNVSYGQRPLNNQAPVNWMRPLPPLQIPHLPCMNCGRDAQMVCSAWKVCQGWYCNKQCQIAHWMIHQQRCPGQALERGTQASAEAARSHPWSFPHCSFPWHEVGKGPRGCGRSNKMRGGENDQASRGRQRRRGQRGSRGHFQCDGSRPQGNSDQRDGSNEMNDTQGFQDGNEQRKNLNGKSMGYRNGPNKHDSGRPSNSQGLDQTDYNIAATEGCEQQGPNRNEDYGGRGGGKRGSNFQESSSAKNGCKDPEMLEDEPSKTDAKGQTESATSGPEPRNNYPMPTPFDEPAALSPRKGEKLSCAVAHFDSPSSIWLHLSSNAEILKAMAAVLEQQCSSISPIDPAGLHCGRMVAARCEGGWYRAKVISMDPLTIEYMDFGNKGGVDLEDMVNLPQHCENVPPLVTHCRLAGVNPKAEEGGWTTEASALLGNIAKQGGLKVECIAMREGKARIHLFNLEGELVSDLLLKNGHGQATHDVVVGPNLMGMRQYIISVLQML